MSHPRASIATLFAQGTTAMDRGDAAAAEAAYRAALQLDPKRAEVHANLGLLLQGQGRLEEAEEHYRSAVAGNPRQAQIHMNFASLLAARQRFAEAEAAYRRALALSPQLPGAWSNLGVLLACVHREQAAEHCHRRAMRIDPHYRNARFNLAYLLLRQGRYAEGWPCLEARDWYAPLENYLKCPRWQGESLAGKSLLIGYEAGHGDMMQFCRYATLLKARGAERVSLLCHPALTSLFGHLAGVDQVIAFDAAFPDAAWDFWVPLLSLPFLFATRLETIPAKLPYLGVDAARISAWAKAIDTRQAGLRVGLVWKGNPDFENDAERSLPSLALLSPLAKVAGIRYFSLQKGAGAQEAASCAEFPALVDLGQRIADFADTAAIIMNLDLLISVDTGVAHLAGALNRPCWVMLPDYKTDWRWLKDRTDSPWYPGALRLFRQARSGHWDETIAAVATALRDLLANRDGASAS